MSGWENFGERQKQTYWDSSLDVFDHTKFAGVDVEMRLITEIPFVYVTHWVYRDLIDAWLHANDREALKAKYKGKLSGKTGPKKKSWECLDFNHETRRSDRCNDPLCTTYSRYIEIPDPTSLFQAFWRVPSSPNAQLRNWQAAKVFRFGRGAAEKLGTVIRDQGKLIADPDKGYSIYTTYTANQGANTWSVRFGSRSVLPPAMRAAIPKSLINFADLYQKPTVQEVEDWLLSAGYPKLLDPNFVPTAQGQGGQGGQAGFGGQGAGYPPAAPGGYPPGGRAPARQQPGAGYPPVAPGGFPAAGGYATQDAGYEGFTTDEFAPGQDAGFQDPNAGLQDPGFSGGDFGVAGGDFGPAGGFDDQGFAGAGAFPQDGGFGGDEFDAVPELPPAQPQLRQPAQQLRPQAPAARPPMPGQQPLQRPQVPMAPRPGIAQAPRQPMPGQQSMPRPVAPPGYQQPGARPMHRPAAPPQQPGRR
jgi:hypothetical protein